MLAFKERVKSSTENTKKKKEKKERDVFFNNFMYTKLIRVSATEKVRCQFQAQSMALAIQKQL